MAPLFGLPCMFLALICHRSRRYGPSYTHCHALTLALAIGFLVQFRVL